MYKRPYNTPACAVQYYVLMDTGTATNAPSATKRPDRPELPLKDKTSAEMPLEDRVDRPDWIKDDVTYRAWLQSLANPGVLVALPSKFRCHECGGTVYQVFCGVQECAWCARKAR